MAGFGVGSVSISMTAMWGQSGPGSSAYHGSGGVRMPFSLSFAAITWHGARHVHRPWHHLGWFGWVGAIFRCIDAECARRSGRIAGLPLSRGLSTNPLLHALVHAAL